jgi:hypothetical protein
VRLKWRVPLEMLALAIAAASCAPPHAVKRTPEVFEGDASVVADPPSKPKGAPNGTRCQQNGDCGSGYCVDGVCCQSACSGVCQACDNPGSEGLCLSVVEGQDPDNECDEQPATSCGRDGMCDGHGACRRYPAGTACSAGSCRGDVETAAGTCDGAGACRPGTTRSCAPAVCIDDTCGTACTLTSDCQEGFFCDGSTCRTRRAQGAACDKDEQCGTGHCADKVCCSTACQDKCYACNATGSVGSCTAVGDGVDPRQDCLVQNIFTCGNAGGCNGRGACRLHLPGTPCSSGTTCAGSTLTGQHACDGMGACKPGPKSDCAPYVCNGGTVCWTVCATNDQCKAPRTCRANKCQ